MNNFVERVWTIVASCRRCGAPMFCKTEEMRGVDLPKLYRLCDCLDRANKMVDQFGHAKEDLLGRAN